MAVYNLSLVLLAILLLKTNVIQCRCFYSHVTICDSLQDVLLEPTYKKSVWLQLIVKGDRCDDTPQHILTPQHLKNTDLLSQLTIFNQLTNIEIIDLKGLSHVILNDNNIQSLTAKTFIIDHNMKQLTLQNNNIANIQPGFVVLGENGSLSTIHLSYNKLSMLKTHLFSTANRIVELDVRHNRLSKFGQLALPANLEMLRLDGNEIRYLSKLNLLKQNLTKLAYLTVSHNKLRHLVDLPNMKSLKYLDVSFNYIHEVGKSLEFFHNVETWNFESNKLTSFQIPIFVLKEQGDVTLYQFSLANNRLRNLEIEPPRNRTLWLTLRGNPWNCRCIQEMETIIMDNKNTIARWSCDWEMVHSGSNPHCVVDESLDEECSDGPLSEERYQTFKQALPEETECLLDLPSIINSLSVVPSLIHD